MTVRFSTAAIPWLRPVLHSVRSTGLRAKLLLAFTALSVLAIPGCAGRSTSTDPLPRDVPVRSWGSMREALRNGQSEARVELAGLAGGGAIGVGALAGLAGEVTIANGRVFVATVDGDDCHVTDSPDDGAAATLLVHAQVTTWRVYPLPDCATYLELEAAIAAELKRHGFDPTIPTPVRVRGHATQLEYHVIAGACPIADPTGPAPWRFARPLDDVELVGFFVEGAAGRFTHHDRRSHLHVLAPQRTGHLDAVSLSDAVLRLPALRPVLEPAE